MATNVSSPTVVDVIRARMESGNRDDGFKVGLALEGGGLRGVVSGAMLIALRTLGADRAFDCYTGTSSGSINLSYFLTGASWDALAVYYDHLLGRDFIDPRRAVGRRPILDLDYLFDEVMAKKVPLDYEAVASLPPGLLNVTMTNVDEAEPVVRDSFASPDEVYHLLKAGSWLPLLAGRPYQWEGARYLDSGVLYPDPLVAALDTGCTHIFVCNTRPQSATAGHRNLQRVLLRRTLNHYTPGLGEKYFKRRAEWDKMKAEIGYGESQIGDTRVFRLAASKDAHAVDRLTRDRGVLLAGARAGYASVFDAFNAPHDHLRFAILDVPHPTPEELARLRHDD